MTAIGGSDGGWGGADGGSNGDGGGAGGCRGNSGCEVGGSESELAARSIGSHCGGQVTPQTEGRAFEQLSPTVYAVNLLAMLGVEGGDGGEGGGDEGGSGVGAGESGVGEGGGKGEDDAVARSTGSHCDGQAMTLSAESRPSAQTAEWLGWTIAYV